jgi:DNA mismatch endonuclease, patch repair protein
MRGNIPIGTKPEIALAKQLGKKLSRSNLPGSPDIVYRRAKLAVFVNGCFWHRCPQHGGPLPKTHRAFWKRKFERNVERDRLNREELEATGWSVLVVWEHELREDPRRCARRVKAALGRL